MVFPVVLVKLTEWILYQLLANSYYRAARKVRSYGRLLRNLISLFKLTSFHQHHQNPIFPSIITNLCDHELELCNRKSKTLACDIDGGVLFRSSSSKHFHPFFPFFMLVAFEGGSIIRALLLLLSCSFIWVLDFDLKLRVLSFITFAGLRVKNMDNVAKAVFPKFFLESLNLYVYDIWVSTGTRIAVTSLPKVMVETFLREYLGADDVVGTKMRQMEIMGRKYYTGFASGAGFAWKSKAVKEYFDEKKKKKKPEIGLIGSSSSLHDHNLFISICKETYAWSEEDAKNNMEQVRLPRERYPKPLIFHDGRLAFLPTPLATLFMFLWLPVGIFLAFYRLFVGILLPYRIGLALGCLSGITIRFKSHINLVDRSKQDNNKSGVLFVCNHRTLLDPVFLSISLGRPLMAVTYSLSKFSEVISPIKTVRLRRDRKKDGEAMQRLLSKGDLVVCPEGTTCREPFLLRFSPLFAELTQEIVPVAVDVHVSMFYGTTASGFKWLDPIFFLMNPRPVYRLEILEKLPKEMTCGGGKSSVEVANFIQRELGRVLGFQCTSLTRKDKYLALAGNEGIVK